ncbi:ubiquinone biosynthesis protein [Microbacterium endophyticum]|uniref:Ubiquinone biosynthesis protein n=1 Tax=Microbacterium endophyticum TaxID=1526412 RepID=A0A7W4V170_9MICO|nr:AarF/UbiB family protein [Microbacterium endophyticum]MBB2974972.1 ubiquinone biosynthesis protein [Microbacterium endophyticum]NIK37269.1 ubiquinone biosynthesis protein [Microbacterium endophyticum]
MTSSSMFAPPRFADLAAASAGEKPLTGRARRARFWQIFRLARTHKLIPFRRLDFTANPETVTLRAAQARGLRIALETAGGGFIKAGQLLSTRDDLLPTEWVTELSRLQKEVSPAPTDAVHALLEREIGDRRTTFATFDDEPMAAASIAQVHRATLKDGTPVAVKIQRPGIVALIECDIDIMLRIARWIMRGSKQARQFGALDIARQYADDLMRQTDFAREGSNLEGLRAASLEANDGLHIPKLFTEFSTERVMTMEFVSGDTISSLTRGNSSNRVDNALKIVLRSFLRQLVIDGVFHADLHPGNIIIRPDGSPALIDFGSVGRLDRDLNRTVQDLAIAFLQGDTRRVADAALEIMPLANSADEPAFRRDLASFITNELGDGSRVTLRTVDRAVEVFTRWGTALPADLVAAGRAYAIFEGTLRTAAPRLDILAESRAAAEGLIASQFSPRSLAGTIGKGALGMLPGMRRMPEQVGRIVGDLSDGNLTVNIRLFANERDRKVITGVVRRVSGVTLGGAFTIGSLVMFSVPDVSGGVISPATAGLVLATGAVAAFVTSAIDAIIARGRR